MKTAFAVLVALGLIAGSANARTIFDDLRDTAPRADIFTDIQRTAPRSVFDDLKLSAPRTDGVFGDAQRNAP